MRMQAVNQNADLKHKMKRSTRLSSAVFQLTPTRTRCDLIIIANDKKEKIASGLLNPFLAHLKTAQDQIAKGGYSILLEPKNGTDAAWFTKATLERFVRFVSTPEILERVYTIETEILQIEEAIAMQSNNDIEQSILEDHEGKPHGNCEVNRSPPNDNEEKAIVLYTPGASVPEANGSCLLEGNSKVQLLKVFETRKTMLQKEQGMAFARAAAAGFDIDHLASLVSFAECFGALRLMEACSRFIDLSKKKHETGEWLDIEASEALSSRPDFSNMNTSGIIFSAAHNKNDESNHEQASEDNGNSGSTYNADNPAPISQQEYFQGQFPHIAFPPWPMHAPPGAQPVFQPYPVQGIPYYQTYAGSRPFFQPPHHPLDHFPSNLSEQSGQKIQTYDVRDVNTSAEVSHNEKPRKKAGGSKKKQPGMVVIRNVNYINSKEKKSDSESNSNSDSDFDTEDENFKADDLDSVVSNTKSSLRIEGNHVKSVDKLNFSNDRVSNSRKDAHDGNWQAFQNCLLRGSDEDAQTGNEGMFAMEKNAIIKRRINTASIDQLSEDGLPYRGDHDFRGSNGQTDGQFAETNGTKILSRTTHEDFTIGSQQNQGIFRSSSDPLAVNLFEGATNKMDRESTQGMADETFIVPFRSVSMDQVRLADRAAIDVDSEVQLDTDGNINKLFYEPDALSLIPERGTESRPVGYDPALDYEMQVSAEGSIQKDGKDVTEVKEGLRNKDRKPKVTLDSVHKHRSGGSSKGKPSKMSPSEDARVRAERLRSYKADLQKMKKEQEEADAKRLEALKLERQKRIAARGSSNSVKPSVLSPQTKQIPAKLSPATNRSSKFSDSEPGSSSPLQRSKIRTSLGSTEPLKASKASKLSEGSHMAGDRLTRSSSSLSEIKIERNVRKPDSKASMAQIRRLSEPKVVNNPPPVSSVKTRSAEAGPRRKLYEGPEMNKISAIINLDRSKAATLPELKIKVSKSHENAGENTSSAVNDQKIGADENPVVEKNVVMLEYENPSLPILHKEQKRAMFDFASNDASPSLMDGVDRVPISSQLQKHSGSNEVRTAYPEKDNPSVAEKSYQDPCTEESVKVQVVDVKTPKSDKKASTSDKTPAKESSKGLRRLLMFGKKNHTSSLVDESFDSNCTSVDATDHDDNARGIASASQVGGTLKNLIRQDETSSASNSSQKISRHFSLLSPFRSKTKEKKQLS
ncbi:hypothetical protein ACP275_07G050500 [Erythranthe tilingii]